MPKNTYSFSMEIRTPSSGAFWDGDLYHVIITDNESNDQIASSYSSFLWMAKLMCWCRVQRYKKQQSRDNVKKPVKW